MKTAKCLSQDPLNGVLCVVLFSTSHLLDDSSDGTVHELHEDPKNVPRVVISVHNIQAEAILARAEFHEGNLVVHELLVLVSLWRAELESELFLVRLALNSVYFGETTGAQLIVAVDIVVRRGVIFLPNVVLLDQVVELLNSGKLLLLLEHHS